MAADPATDRGNDVGKFDIELGRLQRAFRLQYRRMGRLQRLAALIDDGVGDRPGLIQGQGAVQFALSEFGLGAGRELAVGLLGDRFKGTEIDDIEEIAGIDGRAVAKFNAGDEPADAGANLNLLDRLEPPGEFVPIGDGAFGWLGDGNGGPSCRSRTRRLRAERSAA
jgi:hypothetical protein